MSDIIAPGSLLVGPRVGLRAVADQRRPIVIVLGMHRSGTSLCSHVLSALGVDMSEEIAGPGNSTLTPDNAKGHWERWAIVDFHDRILDLFDRGYYAPIHDFSLPVAWWADPRVATVRREITTYIEGLIKKRHFGFKDPRTTRLMPMWQQILAELQLAPKIIYCLRNPAQVARSVNARDSISVDLAEYRWLSYNLDFFRYIKAHEFCTLEYESWFDDPTTNLVKLRAFLGLPSFQSDSEIELEVSEIVDAALRHDDPFRKEGRSPLIRSVYTLARRAEHDAAARGRLENIAVEFLSFQRLQAAFERDVEQKLQRSAELEQEATALRTALGERDTRLAALEIERTGLRDALARAKKDADERQRALEAASLELAARDSRLGEVEAELADRAAVAEQSRTELNSIRQQTSTEIVNVQREIASLQDALRLAERNAEAAEHRTSEADNKVAALSGQIATLRADLANARRVARLAVQALSAGLVRTVYCEPRLGWRQTIRRLCGMTIEWRSW